MPGVGVISNPRARLNRLSPKIKDRLAFIVGRQGEVASTWSLDEAEAAARAFMESDIDLVAISGGDGTAHRTLELLLRVYGDKPLPPILLLPTGTQNMVPRSFGITGSSLATMLVALARYRHNLPIRCVERNLLRVNDHYSFMFGLGIAARFLQRYYDRGETTPLGAAKLLGSLAWGALRGQQGPVAEMVEPIPLQSRLDEGPWRSGAYHTVFCSFVERLPLRFQVFPRAGWDPNVFEVLSVDASPAQVVRALPAIWAGSTRPVPALQRSMARAVEFRLERPEPYVLDGEIYEPADHYRVSAGPQLRFAVPGIRPPRSDGRRRETQCGPWGMRFFV